MKRIGLLYVSLAAVMVIIVSRLFLLQIVLGEKNRAIADGNRIRKVTLFAPRGVIYDREGRELTRNVPVYRHCKLPGKRLINEPEKSADCRLVSRDEAFRLEAEGLPADEEIRLQVGREYLYGPALAPVIGYLNWDLAGTTGLEKEYDDRLKGKNGGEIFEVDSDGAKQRRIERAEAVAGGDLNVSIDAEVSRAAFEALAGKPGAVVATEAKTGRVIVLVSSPSFDPGIFSSTEVSRGNHLRGGTGIAPRDEELEGLFTDPLKPLFNRAVAGLYPPGSTFKIVSAAAGLEEGKIDGSTLIEDTGYLQIGEYRYRNWYFTRTGKTEGLVNVVKALQRSVDTFFYKVGELVGAESLADWAGAFGLGKTAGIDIGGEAAGLVPTPDWKEAVMGERWFLGNTYHLSIGQGDLQLTPLQVNMMTSVIANGGKLCQPSLRQEGGGAREREEGCRDLKLKQETIDLIKEGLVAACSPGGTSGIFQNIIDTRQEGEKARERESERAGGQEGEETGDPVVVACKTGTAEYGPVKANGYRDTHAWFTAFAPVDDPEIVVTAVVEGGGEGSEVAAPIVKKVLEEWYNGN